MKIYFKKDKAGNGIINVLRDDGSTTWNKMFPNFAIHDLAHLAIEKELNSKLGFFGLLNRGHNIQDFDLPKEERPEALLPSNLPKESIQIEHFVNLLLVEFSDGSPNPDFIEMLNKILAENQLPPMNGLNEAKLNNIRAKLKELDLEWKRLPSKGVLEYEF